MQVLPIGVQDFGSLRADNLLYVDKTEIIYTLTHFAKYTFLSRPRRFGKSLLLSTIKALYLGNRAAFEGLWIADKWDWTKTYPVLHISMAEMTGKPEQLEIALSEYLDRAAIEFDVLVSATTIKSKFAELLKNIAVKHGRIVVLIDEYDKPMIDYITEPDTLEANRKTLSGFYSVLKDADPYLRFVMLTDVSKFSKVSVFSGLNNLKDITMDEKFGAICGYTQTELEANFEPYIENLATKHEMTVDETLAKIKHNYNGYFWAGTEKVYNPFSTLLVLDTTAFDNFWFETGTPTFIIDLLKNGMIFQINKTEVDRFALKTASIEELDPIIVLFQTGYLTIVEENKEDKTCFLAYPNEEVKESMNRFLLAAYSYTYKTEHAAFLRKMNDALKSNDLTALFSVINTIFASIPHQIFIQKYEAYFHSVLYLVFNLLGYRTESEVSVHEGRIDWIVKTATHIYIVEFKINKSAAVALAQIKNRNYHVAYLHQDKTVVLVGVSLDSKKKCVKGWTTENIVTI